MSNECFYGTSPDAKERISQRTIQEKGETDAKHYKLKLLSHIFTSSVEDQ